MVPFRWGGEALSPFIQYKIAEDINGQDINDQTNVFDMIQGYCSAMASVGDGGGYGANFAGTGINTHNPKGKFTGKCNGCGKSGH